MVHSSAHLLRLVSLLPVHTHNISIHKVVVMHVCLDVGLSSGNLLPNHTTILGMIKNSFDINFLNTLKNKVMILNFNLFYFFLIIPLFVCDHEAPKKPLDFLFNLIILNTSWNNLKSK